jgi:hypothetical protein
LIAARAELATARAKLLDPNESATLIELRAELAIVRAKLEGAERQIKTSNDELKSARALVRRAYPLLSPYPHDL